VEVWKCVGEEVLDWLAKFLMSPVGPLRCHVNGDVVQLSHHTKLRLIYNFVTTIKVYNYLYCGTVGEGDSS